MTHTLSIDAQTIRFQAGQSVLQAALAAGIEIPHLCYHPELSPHGNCKLCTVEVDGRKVAACTLPATAGMQVINNTPALQALRKTLVQLLFVEGNHLCPTCAKSGNCSLQTLGYRLGMVEERFPLFYPRRALDASHPAFVLDRDRCVLCALCVRASREVDGKNVFAISGRGLSAHLIVNSPSGRLGDSDLSAHDRAAHICPVGAILPKLAGAS